MDDELYDKRMETRTENFCFSSTSFSPSAVNAAEKGSFAGRNWECEANRMVRIEFEAAEVLAGLAHSGIHERNKRGSVSDRKEGEVTSKRVKNKSPPGDYGLNPEHSVPEPSILSEDRDLVVQQQYKKICNVVIRTATAKQHTELLPNPSSICATSYGGKSRQNLTEAEKEARRLRRVLANRESARQTIRRRQALYEELTSKAAHLSWENDNLKREKGLAMKEYDSLKTTNQNLKVEMAKKMKAEAEETQKESNSTDPEISITTTPTSSPFFVSNQPPFAPFLWPSMFHASNPFQLQPVSSIIYMPSVRNTDSSHEQENPTKSSGPGPPLYVVPCSWFLPFPDHGNRPQPWPTLDLNVNQNCASPSLEVASRLENRHLSLPIEVETEPSSSIEAIPCNSLCGISFGSPPDGGIERFGHHTPGVKAIFSTVARTVIAFPEKNKDTDFCRSKKVMDSVAAAEARKRRKELKKLKKLHCRQV